MGIYDSRKSAWQRHKDGEAQDHAGRGVIGEVVGDDKVVKQPLSEESTVEEEEVKEEKKTSSKGKKSSYKKSSETE